MPCWCSPSGTHAWQVWVAETWIWYQNYDGLSIGCGESRWREAARRNPDRTPRRTPEAGLVLVQGGSKMTSIHVWKAAPWDPNRLKYLHVECVRHVCTLAASPRLSLAHSLRVSYPSTQAIRQTQTILVLDSGAKCLRPWKGRLSCYRSRSCGSQCVGWLGRRVATIES